MKLLKQIYLSIFCYKCEKCNQYNSNNTWYCKPCYKLKWLIGEDAKFVWDNGKQNYGLKWYKEARDTILEKVRKNVLSIHQKQKDKIDQLMRNKK